MVSTSVRRALTSLLPRPLHAGFRVVAEVVSFRLRNLEMANLAGAASIAVALHLPWPEVLYRTLFAFLLNALVYLNNDYLDVADDLRAPLRMTAKTRFLAGHMDAALAAQWSLVVLLVALALIFDIGLLAPLVLGGGICLWYSVQLKHVPGVDVLAMAVWGLTMPICGFPLDSEIGWCLALQLGAFAAVYETIQVIRDADDDRLVGIQTTGVALGGARARWLARTLMVAASGSAALLLHPVAGAIAAGALLVPLDGDIEGRWTRVKLVYGLAWLWACAWIFFAGETAGWLGSMASVRSAPG